MVQIGAISNQFQVKNVNTKMLKQNSLNMSFGNKKAVDLGQKVGYAMASAAGINFEKPLASTYKMLAKHNIKIPKGQVLSRSGNLAKIVDKNSGKKSMAIMFKTNGVEISKIAKFNYDESGNMVSKTVTGADCVEIPELGY